MPYLAFRADVHFSCKRLAIFGANRGVRNSEERKFSPKRPSIPCSRPRQHSAPFMGSRSKSVVTLFLAGSQRGSTESPGSSPDWNIFASIAVAFEQLGYGGMLAFASDVQGLEDVSDGDPVGDVQFAFIA